MDAPASRSSAGRLLYIDWMRGWAVLFMFEAHIYPSWLRPELLTGRGYGWTRILAGYAAPLFLFLAGVGMAMAMVSAQSKGKSRPETRRNALKRGFQIFLAALAFRLQEYLLGGGPPANMLRVDILNCIGLCMMLAATLTWPAERGLLAKRAVLGALLVMVLTPLAYRHPMPGWIPWPIASYLVDGLEYIFPLIPWGGFLFAGLAAGTLWARGLAPATEGRRSWVMPAMLAAGALGVLGSGLWSGRVGAQGLLFGGDARRQVTCLVAHLGWMLVAAALGWALQPLANPRRFGPVRQLGRTSLLMYWVHVELVYGHLAGDHGLDLKRNLSFVEASIGLAGLTLLMLLLSVFRTRYLGAFRAATLFEKLWAQATSYLRESWLRSAQARARSAEDRAGRRG